MTDSLDVLMERLRAASWDDRGIQRDGHVFTQRTSEAEFRVRLFPICFDVSYRGPYGWTNTYWGEHERLVGRKNRWEKFQHFLTRPTLKVAHRL